MVATGASNTTERQHYALQTIFSFFLGLMVLAVVGVGVNTFYPSPNETHSKEMTAISRQIESINIKNQKAEPVGADAAKLARLTKQQQVLQDKIEAEMKIWARNTSIVLVLFATLVMGVSLLMSEQLRVLSNGLLLGGLFTMIYGVGWVLFSGNSTARFVVVLFALVVALGLGYLKFVRNREASSAVVVGAGGDIALDDAALSGLSGRVAALESRMTAVAEAFGRRDDER